MRLLGTFEYSAPKGRDFPRHVHTAWEIVFYVRGGVDMIAGERRIRGAPGVLVATPPGVPHEEISWGGYTNLGVVIDAPADTPWPLVAHDDVGGRIRRLFDALLLETEPAGAMAGLLVAELDLLLRDAGRTPARSGSARLVQSAELLMARDLGESTTIERISAELRVSTSTLREAFLRERGRPPRDRLAEIRLERALAQLRSSDLTLESVARMTGYASASHLSRHVRKATGSTPGQVRHQATEDSTGSRRSSGSGHST